MSNKFIDVLVIMDGYGLGKDENGNCIGSRGSDYVKYLMEQYPSCVLEASGEAVGLPKGQMGNSEVGHLNIGAGRVVYQELTAISKSIEDGDFFQNKEFIDVCQKVKNSNSKLHLLGLLGDGGVHSHISHLFALIDLAKQQGLNNVYIHCITDGRDVSPRSAFGFMTQLEEYCDKVEFGQIASVCGRYYAMDRDNRWERIKLAYDLYTLGEGKQFCCGSDAIKESYLKDITDEFILPSVIIKDGEKAITIDNNDGIIFYNFRPDRARQITRSFMQPNFNSFEQTKKLINISFVTMTEYDKTFFEYENLTVAFLKRKLNNTLGEVLAKEGMTQLRIAETEKYAHVTFFFNGGSEEPNIAETRVLINSPKVATYDLKPEMSAVEVTKKAIESVKSGMYDVMILNYANCDMVGHTGNMKATEKAVYVVDKCVQKLTEVILNCGGRVFLTSDHGNADKMLDEKGNPFTAHTTNKVPFIVVDNSLKTKIKLINGKLSDIAPTMLELMEIEIPSEMTGKSLVE